MTRTNDLTPRRIRAARVKAGLTGDELAERVRARDAADYPDLPRLRTNCVQVSRWETGTRRPTGRSAVALERVLDELTGS